MGLHVTSDLSGLSRGLSAGISSLGQVLQQRELQQQKLQQEERLLGQKEQKEQKTRESQQKALTAVTDWSKKYDVSKSPIENVSSLSAILKDQDIDPSIIQPILKDVLSKAISQEGEIFGAERVLGEGSPAVSQATPIQDQKQPISQETPENIEAEVSIASNLDEDVPLPAVTPDRMAKFSNSDLVRMSGSQNRIVSSNAKAEIENRKLQQRVDSAERDWHTKFSIDQEKKVAALRESIPKKNNALTHARAAIGSGETGLMTGTWLADITGIEAFRGVEGAQLEIAAKEHFFGNMSRVSAKAQNVFFEKLLKNMFAQVGQTPETAMAFIEMLQGELNMDDAFVKEFDRLSAEDERRYTYPRKDVERRARQAVEHLEDLNLDRSLYRVRRLAEAQKSPKEIKKNLMNKVPEGTPLTLERKFMFMDKFGGDAKSAIKAAKRLGYKIPSAADIRLYMMPNKEFAKQMRGE